ncbi:MAG: cation diffusion facilitator family transporter [Candidatus Dormibacteraeota bacterium]|nr:cation diffusion facilitator family transporter [Candidatus Dormibacteraeota bacterium]
MATAANESGGHDHTPVGGRLRLALLLTVAILVVEAMAGWAAHSLALLADAGHILTDVVALALAWFAVSQAGRAPDARRTYGYQRAGILSAMANGAVLIVVVAVIAVEALRRLQHPEPVQAPIVIAAALVAIAVNGFIGFSLRGAGQDLNVRAALLHVLGDLAASVGVVLAGLVILLTRWYPIDPILSLGIAALVAVGGWQVVRRTVNILLEGTPPGMDIEAVRREIESFAGIDSAHDLHVWSLSGQDAALSVHVVVQSRLLEDAEQTLRRLETRLCERFDIGHTTIQMESGGPCLAEVSHQPGSHNHPHLTAR